MRGQHAKQTTRRRWLLPMILAAVVLVAAGAAAIWFGNGHTGTDLPTSAPAKPSFDFAPAVEKETEERVFSRPDEMRGVWLTAGVDYAVGDAADDEAACRAQIDAALSTVADWQWNTVILPLTEVQITAADGFDAPAYLLERARAQGVYVYMALDCGVSVQDGRDPVRLADRLRVTFLARRMAQRYDADGFLLTGYAYPKESLPPAGQGTVAINRLIADATAALRSANRNAYVGLAVEAVWAHSTSQEGGSDTAQVYEQFTDGGADTRALASGDAVDFVMVKDFGAIGDGDAPFETVLNWWAGVCETADKPLIVAHAATNMGSGGGWAAADQLARQVLACQTVGAWRGSTFDSLAALTAHQSATDAMRRAFDGTLMEEYITRTLTLTSPASTKTTTTESAFSLRGSADPNFPLTLNGQEVALTDHGYFTLDVTLSQGDNVFTFENKGISTTYTINYYIPVLKSMSPAQNLTLDGGAAITVSAVAHRGSTVYATVGGVRVNMSAIEVQEEEGRANNSDYVTYSGGYTLPAGIEGQERALGAVSVTGSYSGRTETKKGGTITVKALPVYVAPEVKPVDMPNLTPIDPSKGSETLANGTVMIVTAEYAETFDGNTTDDYSRPTNAYLPRGTTDVMTGTAYDATSKKHYYLLGCGRRVYEEDAQPYITGGTLTANTLTCDGTSVTGAGTALTLKADWRVPFQLQLLPQAYADPAKQDYRSDRQTTEYIDITFYYTTQVSGTPDVSGSPLFSRAEWRAGANHTQVLRLYLTRTAQFYGYHVQWDDEGNITFTFRHPTYVGGNDAAQPLKGFRVVIDPGHGGDSIGTAGGSLAEKTLTLTYSLLLRDKLQALGATVVMTRTGDTSMSLEPRCQITRASGADLFISIHMNGSTSSSARGCTVHYFSDYSIGVAQTMYEQMQGVYTSFGCERRGGYPWSPFYVCRVSEMPALLLECGYMTNAADLELLGRPAFQDALTSAMARGVTEYAKSLPNL